LGRTGRERERRKKTNESLLFGKRSSSELDVLVKSFVVWIEDRLVSGTIETSRARRAQLTSDIKVLQVNLEHQLVLKHQNLPRQVFHLSQPPLPVIFDLPERELLPLRNQLVVRPGNHTADAVATEFRVTKERLCWRRSDDSEEGGVGDDLARTEFVLSMVEEFGFGVEEENVGMDGELTKEGLVSSTRRERKVKQDQPLVSCPERISQT